MLFTAGTNRYRDSMLQASSADALGRPFLVAAIALPLLCWRRWTCDEDGFATVGRRPSPPMAYARLPVLFIGFPAAAAPICCATKSADSVGELKRLAIRSETVSAWQRRAWRHWFRKGETRRCVEVRQGLHARRQRFRWCSPFRAALSSKRAGGCSYSFVN